MLLPSVWFKNSSHVSRTVGRHVHPYIYYGQIHYYFLTPKSSNFVKRKYYFIIVVRRGHCAAICTRCDPFRFASEDGRARVCAGRCRHNVLRRASFLPFRRSSDDVRRRRTNPTRDFPTVVLYWKHLKRRYMGSSLKKKIYKK